MKQQFGIVIVLCGVCVLSCFFKGYADESVTSNKDYIVIHVREDTLKILNLTTHLLLEKTFDFVIKKIELCPSSPFISLISEERELFLYDLEHQSSFYLGGGNEYEQRWSRNGRFTFINRGTSFLIIRTIDLREYVFSEDEEIAFIKIEGHPLGFIEQVYWLHNNWIIYSNGVGDMIPFGVLDIEQQANYFLTGCIYRMAKKKIFRNRCEDIDKRKSIVDIFIEKYENGELTKISHNFYESVLKMTQD